MIAPIRVLVVDDSAFARKVVSEIVNGSPELEVIGIARDGLDALEKISALAPDVVTLDLVMPNLDGIGVLKTLRELASAPAVVVVSMADQDSELGVEALALGAFDVVAKPTALATDRLYEIAADLRSKVVAAGRKQARSAIREIAPAIESQSKSASPVASSKQTRLLLIGASTGGPQALTLLLRALPADFPVPIAIVVHMPEGYTDAFARRVDADVALDVMEARDGLVLRPGLAIIARAGLHLTFKGVGDTWQCALESRPIDTPHRPAVDVLFSSGAKRAGAGTLGVVLTGMGHDGLAGARAIVQAGGRVLTESESSCVVYGMPRSIVEAGLSTAEGRIETMAALILRNL
jgi:two-component system chemotaxis response regulator CheB